MAYQRLDHWYWLRPMHCIGYTGVVITLRLRCSRRAFSRPQRDGRTFRPGFQTRSDRRIESSRRTPGSPTIRACAGRNSLRTHSLAGLLMSSANAHGRHGVRILDEELRDRAVVAKTRAVGNAAV